MKKITAFLASLFFMVFTGFASAEFVDNGDATITDTSTNLMWQKSYGWGIPWDTANGYCTQAGTGSYSDWRLPALTELQLLVDPAYSPTIDPMFACSTGGWDYWTRSVDNDSAWGVSFTNGGASLTDKSQNGYARCVRGATAPTNCISVGSDLSITIPCAQYNGVQYILNLKYYTDPALPAGNYWKLDSVQEK